MSDADQGSLRDLAAAHALGALSADESREFEGLLAQDATVAREVAEYREVAALLALADAEPTASERLRARVLAGAPSAAAPAVRIDARRTMRGPWLPLALAATALLAVWFGVGRARSERGLAEARAAVTERERQLAAQQKTLDALLAPDVQLFQMTATGDPDPRVQFFWDRRRNTAILRSARVRALEQDRVYQLWFIQDGKPLPSVTFRPSASGEAMVTDIPVPTEGALSAIAITEEPTGGSPQPTSPIYVVSKLGA
jgi:anti-sigma-K factor RskA